MNNIPVTFRLNQSPRVISHKVLKALATEFNRKTSRKLGAITFGVMQATMFQIKKTNTYWSLLNGELAGHFGIPKVNRKNHIDTIVETVADNIEVNFRRVRAKAGRLVGGLKIGILIDGFTDILSLPQANVGTEKGEVLNWLEWLLKFGNRWIIEDYEVDLRPGQGRSGLAVMVQSNNSWRVPPEFSGTVNNNWLTQALISEEYKDMISDVIKRELQ